MKPSPSLSHIFLLLIVTMCLLSPTGYTAESNSPSYVFCCEPGNDLFHLLAENTQGTFRRADTIEQALDIAPEGAGILLLADGYPEKTVSLTPAILKQVKSKSLRLYVEYPGDIPGVSILPPRETKWERAVVSSDFFGDKLEKLRILAIHGCRFVPAEAQNPSIVLARVAGFDTAVFGLPQEVYPVLFEMPAIPALVATTKLSHFITGRYAPKEDWRTIWKSILAWLQPGSTVTDLDWTPTVHPAHDKNTILPGDAEKQAFYRGVTWFLQSNLIVQNANGRRDGSRGICEGYSAGICQAGTQEMSRVIRGDCNGESAMALAFGGQIQRDSEKLGIARNILDHYLFESRARRGGRGDPNHSAYGLIAWGVGDTPWEIANYGDDNARLLLGTLAVAALSDSDRWDLPVMECLLANYRTTGKLGFRLNRIDMPDLDKNDWQHYFNGEPAIYAPHYQAYLWACLLWAYSQTGFEPFLQKTENAIRMTMEAYPDQWEWTDGLAQERARMLLPLAWLIRVQDTPQHREWLKQIAVDLLAFQDSSGAIREHLGKPGMGAYDPPQSNEEYGKDEATLLQENGDPVCDLLYTTNFAFLGLHEAASATGDSLYLEAENKLAEFLCRIQIRSEAHPELDGGWYRAFDFRRWEYWGSSADIGWGAWSIESGWTQGWIVAVLGLRQMGISYWDLTSNSKIENQFPRAKEVLLPSQ